MLPCGNSYAQNFFLHFHVVCVSNPRLCSVEIELNAGLEQDLPKHLQVSCVQRVRLLPAGNLECYRNFDINLYTAQSQW